MDVKFPEDVLDLELDGVDTSVQGRSDLLVAKSPFKQAYDLPLSG